MFATKPTAVAAALLMTVLAGCADVPLDERSDEADDEQVEGTHEALLSTSTYYPSPNWCLTAAADVTLSDWGEASATVDASYAQKWGCPMLLVDFPAPGAQGQVAAQIVRRERDGAVPLVCGAKRTVKLWAHVPQRVIYLNGRRIVLQAERWDEQQVQATDVDDGGAGWPTCFLNTNGVVSSSSAGYDKFRAGFAVQASDGTPLGLTWDAARWQY